ncbi:MAG: hypothetical protein OEV64_11025 [Desulfobulbaceae bacterium]|nr:hypothetical protein [Desulfobulbaceae bacterium]
MQILIILGAILSVISLCGYTLYRVERVNESLEAIEQNTKTISALKDEIKAGDKRIEVALIKYFDENYGDTSERAEDLAKLKVLFTQQDARLTNLENALSRN